MVAKTNPGRARDILDVFTRKVALNGYHETNFSEIANELNISKGTIVHHYGTKERLLAALHQSYMRTRLAEARLIVERLPTPPKRLAGLLFAFMLYQEHDRDSTTAFQREIVQLGDDESRKLRIEYLELFRDVIRDGINDGQFRAVDVGVQSQLAFGAAQWAYTWFNPDGKETIDEVGTAFVDLVLGSLLIRRTTLDRLSDPHGDVLHTVRRCLHDVATSQQSPDA